MSSLLLCVVVLTTQICSVTATQNHRSLFTGPEDARLAEGSSRCSGAVEMKHEGEWRTLTLFQKVLPATHKVRYADIACKQMGCGSVVSVRYSTNNTDPKPAWRVEFHCRGAEATMRECITGPGAGRVQGKNASHSSLDVVCAESVRFVETLNACKGPVEVKSGQGWVPVCGDGFDSQTAQVMCMELGCGAPQSGAHAFTLGEELVSSQPFRCKGNESRLEDCAKSVRHDCRPLTRISCSTDGDDLRLVGGASRCSGTLEGKHDREWRPLADIWDYWQPDAVCRHLDCGVGVSASRTYLQKQRAWKLIYECRHMRSTVCRHLVETESRDVMTVVCSENVRLEGRDRCSGQIQVRTGQLWSPVCGKVFGPEEAKVICRHLGCGFAHSRDSSGRYGVSERSWAPVFQCDGGEQRLSDCPSAALNTTEECGEASLTCKKLPYKPHVFIRTAQGKNVDTDKIRKGQRFAIVCSHRSDYRVHVFRLRFAVYSSQPTVTTQSPDDGDGDGVFLFPPADEHHSRFFICEYSYDFAPEIFSSSDLDSLTVKEVDDLRLLGAGNRCHGRVELQYENEWRPLSPRHSWSLQEADVVCRQLKCGSAASTRTLRNEAGLMPTWRFYSDCRGSESVLVDCGAVEKWLSSSTVQVVCSDILPQPNMTLYSGQSGGMNKNMEVNRGHSFTVHCSVEPQFPGGHFSLILRSFNQTSNFTQPCVHHSAVFEFSRSSVGHQGNYSCVYHNSLFGHDFSSSESKGLSVTVKDRLDVMLDDGTSCDDPDDLCCAGKLLVGSGNRRLLSAESTAWDLKHAAVVCAQLDCGPVVSTRVVTLAKVAKVWRLFSDCDGSETSLMDCISIKTWYSTSAIEVVCAGETLD
ncbi:scavenger receptor cysteine-rich type 1 protein M130-like [Solea senegalensis]|uniref:Scavenger receptor cysteine-rich type 1 protein M130-like n=1 Tax=Solea senegalensis TaxID=28829 RepID=A0AAV6Q5I3_SOLSE|nr:scavenger receptor cysteine-rich type 1 protein M130-like [Solea senegalensis]XP_043884690.1 scavenger receptor cysteine-rich type 1 protein M130-like [Solea senegalensis]KAG7485114.1 scavenger receptor cysteine-rich type 1 protein M130-like [Solea senegalensis]